MTAAAAATTSPAGERHRHGWAGATWREPAVLILSVLALMTMGIIMVFSATRCVDPSVEGYYFERHLMFLPVALAALAGAALLPYRCLGRSWAAVALVAVAVALLAAVLVYGTPHNGARRWFSLEAGSLRVSFQPSELAKVALVVFLAWYLGREAFDPKRFVRGFLVPMAVVGAVCGLVAKEDFGTGALIGLVSVAMCIVAGCRLRYLLTLVPPAALGVWLLVWRVPYRLERLTAFLDPWASRDGAGWHIAQSLMAIGRGGLAGVGLGAGVQKYYVPENATDFIFTVICEEGGILGGILVLGLFGVFVWRGGRIVRHAADRFGFLLAAGVLLVIGLQAVMNIGVVTGALPAKGIGLPFISYGGSGLVMMSAAAGLLASVARGATRAADARPIVYRP